MRIFPNLATAISEVRRDVYSGEDVVGTRVQQKLGEYNFRERLGYSYGINGEDAAWPENNGELIELGKSEQMKYFQDEYQPEFARWLDDELYSRLHPENYPTGSTPETYHPALSQTFEGNWPAYTYRERLVGAMDAMSRALISAPDSRRAFWPLFRTEDAVRASAPTRIPCSLGYQALVRKDSFDRDMLVFFYLERSSDFDTFWLTDIWAARKFQLALMDKLKYEFIGSPWHGSDRELVAGPVIHQLISLHSFDVAGTEVY